MFPKEENDCLTEEIPQRAFINAQIVQAAEDTGDWRGAVEAMRASYRLPEYQFMNQAYLASLLYCLLVVPKEIWIKQNRAHPVLDKIDEGQLRKTFEIRLCKDPNFDRDVKYNLLHKLRNSVAHVNYETDENMTFIFWNESRGNKTFRCTVAASSLMWFLSEVGAALANLRTET